MADNAIWKLPYTAEQIQAAQTNLIPIVGTNGNWWRWNIAAMKWEDTGVEVATGIADGTVYNPNLLHNWYFADPVNQRGLTEYGAGGTVYIYTIDRWLFSHTLRVLDDCVAIVRDITTQNPSFYQIVGNPENYGGKTVTLSALVKTDKDGSFVVRIVDDGAQTVSVIPAAEDWQLVSVTRTLPETITHLYASVQDEGAILDNDPQVGDTCYVKAVKLELGSQQTLAHQDENGEWVLNDPPPDKNIELLKCCMSTADTSDSYANNKVTPAAINAVNKSGDTMTGLLLATLDGEGRGIFTGNGGGGYLETYKSDYGNRRHIALANIETAPNDARAVYLWNSTAPAQQCLFHTQANKPSGSYTGNGSATTRTIETGGIGNVCAVWTGDGTSMALVTPCGALVETSGTAAALASSAVKFADGVLSITSAGTEVNASGVTYYYQVL